MKYAPWNGQKKKITMGRMIEMNEVEAYINGYEGEICRCMEDLRQLILSCHPLITEKISWRMPTFVLNGNLVHFAAFKQHIGLYPGAEAMEVFADKLTDYKHSKGAVQFPYAKPMPWELIKEIVMFRVGENGK